MNHVPAGLSAEEEHGRTSEEEEGGLEQSYDRQVSHIFSNKDKMKYLGPVELGNGTEGESPILCKYCMLSKA